MHQRSAATAEAKQTGRGEAVGCGVWAGFKKSLDPSSALADELKIAQAQVFIQHLHFHNARHKDSLPDQSERSGHRGSRLDHFQLDGTADIAFELLNRLLEGQFVGRLSVVTFLHEFGHALGYGERGACRWSINLFRRCFPRSFARCRQAGHTLVRE